MSPVTSLILLLAFSYASSSALPDTEEITPPPEKTCPADVDYPTCENPAIQYRTECDADHNCTGEKICCFSGCRNRCLSPLQEKSDFCPYFDHSICVYAKPTPSECHSDDQCQGTERCCYSECKYQCVPTVTEKPGTCPADVDYPTCENPAVQYRIECDTDHNCTGEEKCCYSGCRNRCLSPLQDKLDSCPYINQSYCVYVRPTPSECHSDDQCQGTDRCCCSGCHYECVPTVTVKPGQCPAPKKICCQTDSAQCETDRNCTGNEKCCDQCGLKCVTPEQEHDGVCPTSIENLSCLTSYKTLCNRDSDCSLEQKCCLSGDTVQCQTVTNEKPGSCPTPVTLCASPPPDPLCTSDRICPGGKKCCTPVCQQTCTDPNTEPEMPIFSP